MAEIGSKGPPNGFFLDDLEVGRHFSSRSHTVTADEIKAAYVSNPDVRKDVSGAYKIDYAHIFITGAKRVVNSWTAALKRVVASGNRTKYW